MINVRCP